MRLLTHVPPRQVKLVHSWVAGCLREDKLSGEQRQLELEVPRQLWSYHTEAAIHWTGSLLQVYGNQGS